MITRLIRWLRNIGVTPADCYGGRCACPSAAVCKFRRCSNCDNLTYADGRWIDDEQYHGSDPDRCPDCGAAMRRQ